MCWVSAGLKQPSGRPPFITAGVGDRAKAAGYATYYSPATSNSRRSHPIRRRSTAPPPQGRRDLLPGPQRTMAEGLPAGPRARRQVSFRLPRWHSKRGPRSRSPIPNVQRWTTRLVRPLGDSPLQKRRPKRKGRRRPRRRSPPGMAARGAFQYCQRPPNPCRKQRTRIPQSPDTSQAAARGF